MQYLNRVKGNVIPRCGDCGEHFSAVKIATEISPFPLSQERDCEFFKSHDVILYTYMPRMIVTSD